MSDRLQELKDMKAWLKPELKDEYNALKAAEDAKEDKPKTITMTAEELKAFVNSEISKYKDTQGDAEGMEEAIRFGKWIKDRQPKKRNHTATMKLYREDGLSEPGLIIDWKFIKNIENVDSRKMEDPLYQITVLYEDGKRKNYEIKLEELAQINEVEKVEIVEQKVEEQKLIQGEGQRPHTEGGYSYANPGFFGTKAKVGSGETFEYIIKRKEITCTIKRPNGQTLSIHSDRLNQ